MMKLTDILIKRLSEINEDTVSKLKEKIYVKQLQEYQKEKLIHASYFNNFSKKEDFLIMYIITISFLKANTNIHVSDIKGNTILFYNAGSVGLVGKQKINRAKCVLKLISLIIKKASFLKNYPIAVHLSNVESKKSFILNKLKTNFIIKIVKIFNQIPHNGCRKKKIRRKKFVKRNFK